MRPTDEVAPDLSYFSDSCIIFPVREGRNQALSPDYHPVFTDAGVYLLSSIIDNTQNVIYVEDIDGRFLLVNTSFCDIFDFRRDDVLGKTPFELFPHDIAVQHLENDRQIITSRTPMTFNEQAVLADGLHDYISVKFPIPEGPG